MKRGRLLLGDILALAAALVLLLVMALDWYGTTQGDEARRIEGLSQPRGAQAGEIARQVRDRAREKAEAAEKNAWQADAFVDRLILLALLAAVVLAVVAAFARSAGRRFDGPWTPSLLAAIVAATAAALVAYRIVQPPGVDDAAVLKAGPPLALVCLGALAFGALWAWRAEEDGRAWPKGDESRSGDEGAPLVGEGTEAST